MHRSIRKAQKEHPKFYFFDIGVKRQLDRTIESKLIPTTVAYGEAFEHFVILEIYRIAHYFQKNWTFSYFQSKEGKKIDLIISLDRRTEILIEIKSTTKVNVDDYNNILQLSLDFNAKKTYLLSLDKVAKKIQHLECLYWEDGLNQIFAEHNIEI